MSSDLGERTVISLPGLQLQARGKISQSCEEDNFLGYRTGRLDLTCTGRRQAAIRLDTLSVPWKHGFSSAPSVRVRRASDEQPLPSRAPFPRSRDSGSKITNIAH